MTKKLFIGLLVILSVSVSAFGQTEKIVGKWKTIDDKTGVEKSIVSIYKTSDGKYAGKVEKLFKVAEAVCKECEGSNKNKPIVGMVIIDKMEEKEGNLGGGTILDPKTGKTYKCFIQYDEKTGNLKVRGSLDKLGMLGRTQTWIRVK
ncbi:MAG: DUF2147 domain-containing protein [Paludibacteraceae bacterium]